LHFSGRLRRLPSALKIVKRFLGGICEVRILTGSIERSRRQRAVRSNVFGRPHGKYLRSIVTASSKAVLGFEEL
jgi:hypothetical protein